MSSKLQQFKQMAESITKKSKDQFDHMSRLGVKADLDTARNIRLHVIANALSFMKSGYDVNAKIEYIDDVITMNMPWGEPLDTPNFLKIYIAWKMLKIDWKLILSEKYRYGYKQVKVEFDEPLPIYPEDYEEMSGKDQVQYRKVPRELTVSPQTAWEMYFNYNDPSGLEFKSGLKFQALGMVSAENGEDEDDGTEGIYNSRQELYDFIEAFGEEEILERAWIVLACTFRAKHITPNEPIVVPPGGQQQPQSNVTIVTQTEDNEQ